MNTLKQQILEFKVREERSYTWIAKKSGVESSHIRKWINGQTTMSEEKQNLLKEFLKNQEGK